MNGQCGKLVTVVDDQFITLAVSTSVYSTVGVMHRVALVCQRQRDLFDSVAFFASSCTRRVWVGARWRLV